MRSRLICFCLLAAAALAGGCNYVVGLGYLLGGPPSIEPKYDKATGKSMTDADVKVAVACFAPKELQWDNAEVDHELAEFVAHRLYSHKITVCRPDQVRAWIDAHPDWDKPEEIGEGVEVTHVIFIDLSKYSLYEHDAPHLYRGRAEAVIKVVEKQPDGEWNETFVKDLISVYPLAVPRPASQESFGTFKRKYLERLSEVIGRHFYEYYNGDDLPDVT